MTTLRFTSAVFIFLVFQVNSLAQHSGLNNLYYENGIAAESKNNADSAEIYFKKSIIKYSDAPSYFELAKIYNDQNTVNGRRIARDYLSTAILKDPKNIKYRFLMAKLAEKINTSFAYQYYKDIIDIDSTSSEALYNAGRIKEAEFDDYHNSVFKAEDDANLSLEDLAQKYFEIAERDLQNAIKYDSLNKNAYMHLSFLYEDNDEPGKGIPPLEKLIKLFPDDKDANLYLGLLYYKTAKLKDAFNQYKKALLLMDEDERLDFTYLSVKELLQPIFGDKIKDFSEGELTDIINYFWKYTDPLYLSDYNARLLEHYSRVAYANLRFELKDKNIPGWKTDRGEIVLRYGEPNSRTRYRPQISSGGRTVVNIKTDVWNYDGFSLGFTDQYLSGNFIFSEFDPGGRYVAQFGGETSSFVKDLKHLSFNFYKPKFEGPSFEVPYQIAQFKNRNKVKNDSTDLYVNYALDLPDSLRAGSIYKYAFDWGLFFFDYELNPIFQGRGSIDSVDAEKIIKITKDSSIFINSQMMTVKPDSGRLAFEIVRKIDQGTSSQHLDFTVKEFDSKNISLSDIILAAKIDTNYFNAASIKRGSHYIQPNPARIFTSSIPLYIYFEIYNLSLDKNGNAEYEQKIILSKKGKSSGISSAVNSVLNLVGLGKKREEIMFTSRYQTFGRDSQVNLQLDMKNYIPGDYILTIQIIDLVGEKQVSGSTDLIWK